MRTKHPKALRPCAICGTEFMAYHSKTTRFCSRACIGKHTAARYAAARFPRTCGICSREFSVPVSRAKARFCSTLCANTWLARTHARAKGDKLRGKGKRTKYVKFMGRHEHRVIAEHALGRALLPGEVVHHKDGNSRNNHPDNLVVLKSQGEHARLHFTKDRKCSIPGCGRKHCAKGLCGRHWKQDRKGTLGQVQRKGRQRKA